MLNMLPKFELVPISRYFITLPKARRPSRIPAWRTSRSRSSRMMSAASLATSTAVATDTPTSAVWMEGASLMPSQEADDVVATLEREDDAVFLRGGDAGEDGRLLSYRGESAVGHALDLVATDDAGTVEADLTADVLGDKLVVAGEDLHHDAVAAERAERLGDAFHRRVEEGHEAGEHELTLVAGGIHGLGRHYRVGDGQNARSLRAQLAVGRFAARAHRLIEGCPAIVDLVRRAAGDDALRSPLRDQQPLAAVVDDDGEPSALEVERDLVDLPVRVGQRSAALEYRRVERTLDASLVGAVDIGEGERPLRYLAEWVKVSVEHHVSARERAGLVAAENVHAAEVLDGLEVLDDHLLSRHVRGPAREGDGADHR